MSGPWAGKYQGILGVSRGILIGGFVDARFCCYVAWLLGSHPHMDAECMSASLEGRLSGGQPCSLLLPCMYVCTSLASQLIAHDSTGSDLSIPDC